MGKTKSFRIAAARMNNVIQTIIANGFLIPGYYGKRNYRFAYDNQEKVSEVSGEGNHYVALHWEYDPRLGVRWNQDIVIRGWESPYIPFHNNPIFNTDINGDDPPDWVVSLAKFFGYDLSSQLQHSADIEVEANRQNDLASRRLAWKDFSQKVNTVYHAEKNTLGLFPGMSSMFEGMEGHFGKATIYGAIDAFGGAALKKIGIFGFAAFSKSSILKQVFSGEGKEVLVKIAAKAENQATHLTEKDITGAIKDFLGEPIVNSKTGKVYNHLQEVKDALKGLGNTISELDKEIASGNLSEDVLEAAKSMRKDIQGQKDKIQNVLTKVENVVQNK